MIVISDTTPILSLLKAEHLGLLEKLYGNVLIPEAVYRVLTENPAYSDEAELIKATKFFSVATVENIKSVNVLRSVTGLDAGESEALILFDEKNADLLLMDEHKGRCVAKQLNVKYIGTAGILMLAYDKNLIGQAEAKDCLEAMISNQIRLDKKLINTVMAHIGTNERY